MSRLKTKERSEDQEYKLMKIIKNPHYQPIIKHFSSFPFCLMYWPVDAIDFSLELPNNQRFFFGIVGKLCSNFIRQDGSMSKEIYLCSLGFENSETFVPLCEFSADEISYSTLKRFFTEIIRSGVSITQRIHVDHLWDFVSSINFVTNKISTEKYLNKCFEFLNGKEDSAPDWIITTDVRVLIANVQNWSCFEHTKSEVVKDFLI